MVVESQRAEEMVVESQRAEEMVLGLKNGGGVAEG
jgi:hypothetical protein